MHSDLANFDDEDPSVVYDILREAANRLCALYLEQVTTGGAEDPAILRVRAVRDQVQAVLIGDLEAQVALIGDFNRQWTEMWTTRQERPSAEAAGGAPPTRGAGRRGPGHR